MMEIKGFAAVCLLVHLPSVLNLPLVPKALGQQEAGSRKFLSIFLTSNLIKPISKQFHTDSDTSVQYAKSRTHSGLSFNVKTGAQFLPKSHLPSIVKSSTKLSTQLNLQAVPPTTDKFPHDSPTWNGTNSEHSVNISATSTADSNNTVLHSNYTRTDHLVAKNLHYSAIQEPSKSKEPNRAAFNDRNTNRHNDAEFIIKHDTSRTLKLAVHSDLDQQSEGHTKANDTLLSVGTGLVALFGLGLILGLFSCCCPKKENMEMTKEEQRAAEDKVNNEQPLANTQKPSQVFNVSDLPVGEEDLDDPVSFKDKIKALDNKLIIQPSPDKRRSQHVDQLANHRSQLSPDQPGNRLSQNSPDAGAKRRSQHELADQAAMAKQPKITVSEDDAKASRSIGDNISKSDTQDDISDKIFDNISTHSSVSQPYNPDVVIADTDDEEEFAEIQRGTSILKSFQRAKPPRNRSPATRTSKGKIRKSRPNVNSSSTPSRSRDHTPGSTPSSTSLPVSIATPDSVDKSEVKVSSKNNSLDKSATKLDKVGNGSKNNSLDKKNDIQMTKSNEFSDFDSLMSQSVTSIGSDIVTPVKRNGKFVKNKDSPKKERNESPARVLKSKEREITEKDSRNESPSRYKKNKESPVSKRKNRRREHESRAANRLSADISEKKESNESSQANRLSGVPANASNNIFYLIDPTVKSKCKSVGDVTRENRKSADFDKDAQTGVSRTAMDNESSSGKHQADEQVSVLMRDRTTSDPSRKSDDAIEQTSL